jgi:tRNA-dihydrouridine synthase B
MKNFWSKLPKPILALAPMAGYTDSAFRQICQGYGADVVYSEMASAAALCFSPAKTLKLLQFNKDERPYVVQLFGSDPRHFEIATTIITKKIKPDGIDINFGCPVKKVQKQGAGAILMNNIKLAKEIISAVIGSCDLPVSIKIRSRVGEIEALKFLDSLGGLEIKTIMVHGRSLKQGHAGPIDFEIIKKARDYFGGIVLANGGAMDLVTAEELLEKTSADGLGIARGALVRPWIFDEIKNKRPKIISRNEIFDLILRHARLCQELKGEKGIIELRKNLCWYAKGLIDAKAWRGKFTKVKNINDIIESLNLIK